MNFRGVIEGNAEKEGGVAGDTSRVSELQGEKVVMRKKGVAGSGRK